MTWAALLLWPLVAAIVFSQARLPVALLVTIIGGYLLLPTNTILLDLPGLPGLDKDTIPALVALVFVLAKTQPQPLALRSGGPDWPVLPGLLPRDPVVLVLFLLLFVGNVGTHATNGDPVVAGPLVLPVLRPYDAVSAMLLTFIQFIPFLLARKVLSSLDGQRMLLLAIAIGALIYTLPSLYEVRMSPQINQTVYGFFPHQWAQHWRGSSWRPVVFLQHGLVLSIYFAMAVLAAATLTKTGEGKQRILWTFGTIWLLFVLVMTKSLGALLITLGALGAIYFLPKRLQITFVVGVTMVILLYPVIRAADILPYEKLLANVSAERARSFTVRLDSEQLLLERANQRPLFGWGGWGRSRVYTDEGLRGAITDGIWIIWLGTGGWLKYIAVFGLLSWGILKMFWQRGQEIDKISIGLALALMANLVDLIPNAGISPVTWLLAGALCGRLETRSAPGAEKVPSPPSGKDPEPARTSVYARTLTPDPAATARDRSGHGDGRRDALPYRRSFNEVKRT